MLRFSFREPFFFISEYFAFLYSINVVLTPSNMLYRLFRIDSVVMYTRMCDNLHTLVCIHTHIYIYIVHIHKYTAELWATKISALYGPIARYVKFRVAHSPGMPGTFSPPPRVSDPDMHHGTGVTHVPWCMPGSLTSGFLWSRWRGKRSRHSRCMHSPQF